MIKRYIPIRPGLGLTLLLTIAILLPGGVWAANLLTNGPFESFQSYNGENWRGFPEKYGQGWSIQVIEEDGLHFMDSDTFGQFSSATYGVPYLNYRLEGTYAQSFASRRGFNFILYQSIAATPGQDYAFGGKVVTFWKGSGGEMDDTKIFKRVGIDPTGGTDYTSPNIIWTDWEGTDNAWTSPAVAAKASAGQITGFIQVHNTGGDVGAAHLNTGYIDNFKFEQAPLASLNLPGQVAPGPINASWGVSIPDTAFWNLWGYDLQIKDGPDSPWQTLQSHESGSGKNTSYGFTGQAGKTYTLRVRPWQQEQPNGSPITTAMPGLWQEKSVTVGQAVIGQVMNHTGGSLSGVNISISGGSSTSSGSDGSYTLPTLAAGNFEVAAGNFGSLVAPPATSVNVQSTTVAPLDLTLRPTGSEQGIANNNDFESDLFSNWSVSNGAAASASTADRHTGQRSLAITGATEVSQTNNLAAPMNRPLLSFWYKSDVALTVEFLSDGGVARSSQLNPTPNWSHFILESGLGLNYSGLVGVNFKYSGGPANIFIDEVSIGKGLSKSYLPLILRN